MTFYSLVRNTAPFMHMTLQQQNLCMSSSCNNANILFQVAYAEGEDKCIQDYGGKT